MFKLIIYIFSVISFAQTPFDQFKTVDDKNSFKFYGEKYYYEIYWGYINVGSAMIEVQDVVDVSSGVCAYKIVTNARSSSFIDNFFKVRDINIAYLDTSFKRSYGYYKDINEGNYSYMEYTFFDYPNKRFYGKRIKNKKETVHEGELNNDVFDVLSSLYLYIGSTEDITKKKQIDIVSKKHRILDVENLGKEKVKTKAGSFKTYKLEPKVGEDGIFISKKGKSLYVYISEDDRIPVMLEAEISLGSVKAKLSESKKNH
jgi:hypothetical protein